MYICTIQLEQHMYIPIFIMIKFTIDYFSGVPIYRQIIIKSGLVLRQVSLIEANNFLR